MRKQIQADLSNIADVLRKETLNYKELSESINEFQEIVSGIHSFRKNGEIESLHFDNGMALGTSNAAMCLKDCMRTKMFVKGIIEAIDTLASKSMGAIHILYAGTGPYATLLLPVLAKYSSERVKCSLLEVNASTFESMKAVIKECGFEDFVVEYIHADATQFEIDNPKSIDILVSETMQRALDSEQQVPIVMNLLPQLRSDAILIPEKIDVSAVQMRIDWMHATKTGDAFCKQLGSVIELSRNEIERMTAGLKNGEQIQFSSKVFTVSSASLKTHNELSLLTEIQIFDTTWLRTFDSGLTVPKGVYSFSDDTEKEFKFKMQYVVDGDPGVRIERQ